MVSSLQSWQFWTTYRKHFCFKGYALCRRHLLGLRIAFREAFGGFGASFLTLGTYFSTSGTLRGGAILAPWDHPGRPWRQHHGLEVFRFWNDFGNVFVSFGVSFFLVGYQVIFVFEFRRGISELGTSNQGFRYGNIAEIDISQFVAVSGTIFLFF